MHKFFWKLLCTSLLLSISTACVAEPANSEVQPEQILPSVTVEPPPTNTARPAPTEGLNEQILKRTLDHDGLEREYYLYVPGSYIGAEPVPLLFSFHGYTALALQLAEYTDFLSIADREDFILVYPQGSLLEGKTHWNVGGWTNRSTVDDVGFTEAMIDVLSSEYNIDSSRVYAIGHSNGGYLSFRLACELSDRIAAIVSVSGSMTPETFEGCRPARPVPIMQIHGTADETVPYEGAFWSLSIDEMLAYWVAENSCEPSPLINAVPSNPDTTSSTSVEHIKYEGCRNEVTVEHYKHIDGGHGWLGVLDDFGQSNADLNTNNVIWAFLSQYKVDDIVE